MRGFLPYGLLVIASAATAACSPTVYLIRHGEKPSDGGNGLNAQGVKRSQCIRKIFGQDSDYNITHIMAQTPKSNGKRARPLDTVKPLAEDLGLKVDTSCDRDDPDCVKKVVDDYDGEGNILICWEHDTLTDILETLGVKDAPSYPDDSFDIIWTLPSPYDEMSKDTKENCPGLDD